MCEISGYAELEDDYSNDLFKKEVLAEINGNKRKVTVLQSQDTLASTIFDPSTKSTSSTQRIIDPTKIEVRVEANYTIEWGGTEGTKTTCGANVRAEDEKGNYSQARIERDKEGNYKTTGSASYVVEQED